MERIMLTVKEVSEALGIGINQAYDLVKQDDFPSMKINQKFLIPKEDFYEWINNNVNKHKG